MKGRAARVVLLAGCGRPDLPTATRTLVGARRPWPTVSAQNQWGRWEKGRFPAFRGLKRGGRTGGSPTPASVTRQRTDLEGLGAAREAEREGEGRRGSRRRLEGELLQEGCEEDEELGPGELFPGTSPLAWKRSKNKPHRVPRKLRPRLRLLSRVPPCTGCGSFSSSKG